MNHLLPTSFKARRSHPKPANPPHTPLSQSLTSLAILSGLVVSLTLGLAGCGGGGSTSSTATSSGTGTQGVACDYAVNTFNSQALVNLNSSATWSCSSTTRSLAANSVPNHDVGPFNIQANLDFTIKAQNTQVSATLSPAVASSSSQVQPSGYALNGIKFDPGTGGNCASDATSTDTTASGSSTVGGCTLLGNQGTWRLEALGQTSFNFGADGSNAHVQPTGEYHYHGMPEKFIDKLGKGKSMTLVGWASDGFPMYARYGYTDAKNASSALKVIASSWQKKSTPDSGRPSVAVFPMGTFLQDYEYKAGTGDLDECNGRTAVTPEFPNGIYHYMVTDTWPYVHRCVKGTVSGGANPPPPPPV